MFILSKKKRRFVLIIELMCYIVDCFQGLWFSLFTQLFQSMRAFVWGWKKLSQIKSQLNHKNDVTQKRFVYEDETIKETW